MYFLVRTGLKGSAHNHELKNGARRVKLELERKSSARTRFCHVVGNRNFVCICQTQVGKGEEKTNMFMGTRLLAENTDVTHTNYGSPLLGRLSLVENRWSNSSTYNLNSMRQIKMIMWDNKKTCVLRP